MADYTEAELLALLTRWVSDQHTQKRAAFAERSNPMGAAAYHRGSALITRQLTAEQRPAAFVLMDELNALPKYPDAGTPFGPILFVYDPRGVWWAQCPTTGFGYWYPTLREAVRRWRVTITGYDHGIWRAVPTTPRQR